MSQCELEARTLSELLRTLVARCGPRLSDVLREAGRGSEGVVVLVNGRNVPMLAEGEVLLADGDDVAIFPPVSGG